MSGTRAAASTTENKPFAKRLRGLMEERGENQKALAEELGVKQQTISYYRNGQSIPDAENLVKIAQHYGVTTDFLLGLTEVRTTDTDLKAVCEYTGLREEAVSYLHKVCTQTNVSKPLLENSTLPQQFINALLDDAESAMAEWASIELGILQLLEHRDIACSVDSVFNVSLPELFKLGEEINKKTHGIYRLQPAYKQMEELYSQTLESLGKVVDKMTGYSGAKEAAEAKWFEPYSVDMNQSVQEYERERKKQDGEIDAKT